MKYIYEFWDHYAVRMYQTKPWKIVKTFAFKKLGGKDIALQEAIKFRDRMVKQTKHYPRLKRGRPPGNYPQQNARGWYEGWHIQRDGYLYLYINATCCGKRKRFSAYTYGYDKAVDMAVAWRKDVLNNIKVGAK